jgi:hypothetical protein
LGRDLVGVLVRLYCHHSAKFNLRVSAALRISSTSRILLQSIILSDPWRSMRLASRAGQAKKEDACKASSLSQVIAIYRY